MRGCCCRYFRRLQRRYAAKQGGAAAAQPLENGAAAAELSERTESEGQAAALDVPITCINLLRCNMQARLLALSLRCTACCLWVCATTWACGCDSGIQSLPVQLGRGQHAAPSAL